MMALDADPVLRSFAEPLAVYRQAPGEYIDGYFSESTVTQLFIDAVVQPGAGRDQSLLPEGTDFRDVIRIWTTDEIRGIQPGEKTPADQVEWNGVRYEVATVFNWDTHGRYTKAMAIRVEA